MITRYSSILVTLCLAFAAEGLVASAAAQQSQAGASGDWVMPRTPDGHPDFQGTWTNVTITRLIMLRVSASYEPTSNLIKCCTCLGHVV